MLNTVIISFIKTRSLKILFYSSKIKHFNFTNIFKKGTMGTNPTTTISTAVPLLLLKPTCIETDAHNQVLRSSNAETIIKNSEQKQLYSED